jgi:purine-cytosine permease-like protein
VLSMQGYLILYCIVAGQTLASISHHLNDTVGIVIISVLTLVVSKSSDTAILANVCLDDYLWIPDSTLVISCLIHYQRHPLPLMPNRFECLAWIPNVVAFVVMLGIGGKRLHASNLPSYPIPTVSTVLSFASFVAAGDISWCTMTADYGVYHDPKPSR